MQKSIKEFTVTELKAMGYEQIGILEQANKNLQAINQELESRSQQPTQEVPHEKENKEDSIGGILQDSAKESQ